MSHTDHVRPSRDTTHQCPAKDCYRRVPHHHLACARHWAKVDRATQGRVYEAYRSGDPQAHLVACEEAIEQMNTPTVMRSTR